MLKKYTWILFDADETLFHFDDFKGLQATFMQYAIEFTYEHYQEYKLLNSALWAQYQQGQISATDLQQRRFTFWANELNMHPQELNDAFMAAMSRVSEPMHGAKALLDFLYGKVKLGIITNGFTRLQEARLQRTGFKHYFEVVIVSEEVGITKPNSAIFDYAIAQMDFPERQQVLIVGDTYGTDILGGIHAGLDTCWVNPLNTSLSSRQIPPTYCVASLEALQALMKD